MRSFLWAAALLLAGLAAAPQAARAQATRTWVSGVGDDVNPCSRTAPCKTFAGAISKTAASGEINCLDPGGFGAVTITKSITLLCSYGQGGVLSAGTNGVNVNIGATDKVVLDGLDIDGVGTGLNGVRMLSSGTLVVRKSSIRNHTQYGIDVAAPNNAILVLEDTILTGNSNGGLRVQPLAGANYAFVRAASISLNGTTGVVLGPGAALYLSDTTVASLGQSITNTGATVTSFGNNALVPSAGITATAPRQ